MKFIKHKFTFIKKIIYSKNLYSCTIYAWYPLNSHIKCFRAHTWACIFGLCACLWIASANQNAEQGSPLSAHWDSRNSKCSEASVLVLRHFDVVVKSCLISPPPTLSLPPWCPTSFFTHSPVRSISSVPHISFSLFPESPALPLFSPLWGQSCEQRCSLFRGRSLGASPKESPVESLEETTSSAENREGEEGEEDF